jgi:hypothetical protein
LHEATVAASGNVAVLGALVAIALAVALVALTIGGRLAGSAGAGDASLLQPANSTKPK